MAGWVVTAFHPSCQIPRVPSIEKNWVFRVDGASAAVKLDDMLTPWIGNWETPPTVSGSARPRHSSAVGTMSTAWWYWCRISPRAAIPFGQDTMHGSAVPPLNE